MLIQAVIDLARIDLNDDDKVRWADTQLIEHVRTYVQEAFKSRPDLFFGRFVFNVPIFELALTDEFPMSDRYVRSCADYVIARAMMNSTEEGTIGIANNFLNLSAKQGGL